MASLCGKRFDYSPRSPPHATLLLFFSAFLLSHKVGNAIDQFPALLPLSHCQDKSRVVKRLRLSTNSTNHTPLPLPLSLCRSYSHNNSLKLAAKLH